uniref:Uncharacterized protein n=1 Tax=viral metagenome TaxID=1070528 RepID=A0A6C0E7I9_9ZZZZ
MNLNQNSENYTHHFRYALDNDDVELVKKYEMHNPVPAYKILLYTLIQNLPESFEFYLNKEDLELNFDQVRTLINKSASSQYPNYLELTLKKFPEHNLNEPTNNYLSIIDYLPLNTAIYEKKMVNVSILLEYGAISNISYPKDGQTSLHLAIISGHQGILQFLLEYLTEEKEINKQNNRLNTALHLAALKCDLALVKLLVESNADLSLKNKNGYTAYDLIILNNESNPEDRNMLIQYFEINKAQTTIGQSLIV